MLETQRAERRINKFFRLDRCTAWQVTLATWVCKHATPSSSQQNLATAIIRNII